MSMLEQLHFDEERKKQLEKELENTFEAYKASKQVQNESTTIYIQERNKNKEKQQGVDKWECKLADAVAALGVEQQRHRDAERVVLEQQVVVETTERRVQFEQHKVDILQKIKDAAQEEYDDMEGRFGKVQEAVHEAERVAEKERNRVRRAKEVLGVEEARAADAQRAVDPLKRPLELLEIEYQRMKSELEILDARAEDSREALAHAVEIDTKLNQRFQKFLAKVPRLVFREQEGYMRGHELKGDMEHHKHSIVMQVYQTAFFQRKFEDAAKLHQGLEAKHVGNIKDDLWRDPFGDKGIGHWVVRQKIQELIYGVEKGAVEKATRKLGESKLEYEKFHHEVMNLRQNNDDIVRECRHQHDVADDLLRRLNLARARYDSALAHANDAAAKVAASRAHLEEQELLVDDWTRATEGRHNERIDVRVAADVKLLKLEGAQINLDRALKRVAKAKTDMQVERAKHDDMARKIGISEKRMTKLKEKVTKVEEYVDIKVAERNWQVAKQDRAEVQLEASKKDTERRWEQHLAIKTELLQLCRAIAFAEQREACLQSLKAMRAQAQVFSSEAARLHTNTLEHAAATAGATCEAETRERKVRQDAAEHVARKMEDLRNLTTRVHLGGELELWRKGEDSGLVREPAAAGGVGGDALRVGRCARVFESGGVSFLRMDQTSRPVNIKGWVSKDLNEAGKTFTALCASPIAEGRVSWDLYLDHLGGKGLLYLGVVRDRDALEPAQVERTRALGNTIQETLVMTTLFDVGRSESFSYNLDSYCLGDDNRSWGLASDGVKVHNGVASEFSGHVLREGDVVTCMLDSHARTLSFVVSGRLLGQPMCDIEFPVLPAVSVTRTRTCKVTMANYRRL